VSADEYTDSTVDELSIKLEENNRNSDSKENNESGYE
jgi:hypothetical protein